MHSSARPDREYDVSPMLASHAGLSAKDSTLDAVAAKIAAAAAALSTVAT